MSDNCLYYNKTTQIIHKIYYQLIKVSCWGGFPCHPFTTSRLSKIPCGIVNQVVLPCSVFFMGILHCTVFGFLPPTLSCDIFFFVFDLMEGDDQRIISIHFVIAKFVVNLRMVQRVLNLTPNAVFFNSHVLINLNSEIKWREGTSLVKLSCLTPSPKFADLWWETSLKVVQKCLK